MRRFFDFEIKKDWSDSGALKVERSYGNKGEGPIDGDKITNIEVGYGIDIDDVLMETLKSFPSLVAVKIGPEFKEFSTSDAHFWADLDELQFTEPFDDFPSWWSDAKWTKLALPELKHLKNLPDSFPPNLEYFHLRKAGVSGAKWMKAVEKMENLKHLQWGDSLHKKIATLDGLESLTLPFSRASDPPEWLSEMTELKALTLNDINDQLPGVAPNLERLSIYNFRFTELPENILTIETLKHLDLANSDQFKRLPESMDRLSNLEELSLSSLYELGSLPAGLGRIAGLRRITVDGCNIDHQDQQPFAPLPGEIAGLSKLEYLNFERSSLPGLPPALLSRDDVEILGVPHKPYTNDDYEAPAPVDVDAVKDNLFGGQDLPSDYLTFLDDEGRRLLGHGELGEYRLLTAPVDDERVRELGFDPEKLAHMAIVLDGADGDLVGYWRYDEKLSWEEAPMLCFSNEGDAYVTGRNLVDHLLFVAYDEDVAEEVRAWARKKGLPISQETLEIEGVNPVEKLSL